MQTLKKGLHTQVCELNTSQWWKNIGTEGAESVEGIFGVAYLNNLILYNTQIVHTASLNDYSEIQNGGPVALLMVLLSPPKAPGIAVSLRPSYSSRSSVFRKMMTPVILTSAKWGYYF